MKKEKPIVFNNEQKIQLSKVITSLLGMKVKKKKLIEKLKKNSPEIDLINYRVKLLDRNNELSEELLKEIDDGSTLLANLGGMLVKDANAYGDDVRIFNVFCKAQLELFNLEKNKVKKNGLFVSILDAHVKLKSKQLRYDSAFKKLIVQIDQLKKIVDKALN